jgi:hypothetical protein
MGPGEHRPHDEQYWTPPWSTALFAGDLFEAIPFGDQPTMLYRADDGKHFVGEVGFAYGLLITPTCDMAEQRGEGATAHPFRVFVPVLPLAMFVEQAGAVADSVNLLRSRDTFHPQHVPGGATGTARGGVGGLPLSPQPRLRRAAGRATAPSLPGLSRHKSAANGFLEPILSPETGVRIPVAVSRCQDVQAPWSHLLRGQPRRF